MRTALRSSAGLSLIAVVITGCAADLYTREGDALQLHKRKFHALLAREQVEAAVHENQAIELIGLRVKAGRASGAEPQTTKELERQTGLLDAAREEAAANWLQLAQYFSTRQRYGQARAIYRRIIETYSKGGDRLYADYAQRAIADLDILAIGVEDTAVGRPALSALQENHVR